MLVKNQLGQMLRFIQNFTLIYDKCDKNQAFLGCFFLKFLLIFDVGIDWSAITNGFSIFFKKVKTRRLMVPLFLVVAKN